MTVMAEQNAQPGTISQYDLASHPPKPVLWIGYYVTQHKKAQFVSLANETPNDFCQFTSNHVVKADVRDMSQKEILSK